MLRALPHDHRAKLLALLRAMVSSTAAAAVAVAILIWTPEAEAQDLSGRATVVDGDTLIVEGVKPRIRLYGIDTPEKKQTCEDEDGRRYLCGGRAAEALAEILGRNGRVRCTEEDRDRYGRIVAECRTRDGTVINEELVRRGWALEYDAYSDGRYGAAQASARRAKRGLWAGRFEAPWDWRRAQRKKTAGG